MISTPFLYYVGDKLTLKWGYPNSILNYIKNSFEYRLDYYSNIINGQIKNAIIFNGNYLLR